MLKVDDIVETEDGSDWRMDSIDKKGKYPLSAHCYRTRESISWTKDGYFESDKRDDRYNLKKEFRDKQNVPCRTIGE